MASRGRDGMLRNGQPVGWPFSGPKLGWAPACWRCEVLKRPFYHKSEDCPLSVEERTKADHMLEERKK